MTAQEKEELKQTIDDLPDEMTMEELGEDLMLSAISMKRMASSPDSFIPQEEVEKLAETW